MPSRWNRLCRAAAGTGTDLDEVLADQERQRLFRVIEHLVLWENTTNETVLQQRATRSGAVGARCLENVDHPRAKELFDRKKLSAFTTRSRERRFLEAQGRAGELCE